MRLIDADLFKIYDDDSYDMFDVEFKSGKEFILDEIRRTPTIDAVPVVRCKDCKSWIPGWITEDDDFIPPSCKCKAGIWSSNSFCSDGKRKDGDSDAAD